MFWNSSDRLGSESGGPNGAADDAGLEEMVNLANSQLLQQELKNHEKMIDRMGRSDEGNNKPPLDNVPHENFLLPVNVRRLAIVIFLLTYIGL